MKISRIVVLCLLGLLLFVLLLLNLPLTSLARAVQNTSKILLLAIVGLPCLAVAAWMIWTRSLQLLVLALIAGVMLVATYGVYKFQTAYPMANLFSIERLRDNWSILVGKEVALSKYDPRSTLILDNKPVVRAAYPAIDMHFHLESLPEAVTPEILVKAMDAAGIAQLVNLGGLPGMFEHFATTFRDKYPDRFILFVKPDPAALEHANGVADQVAWMKKAAGMGARGVKENKSFGLGQRDASGKLVAIDDPRLDPYWDLAGKLGWPVLVHTGEPRSFWMPIDEHNERFRELLENPAWSLFGKEDPSFKELMAQRERLLARHPGTHFIGAHLGMNPDDLAYASYLLDKYPNYYVDMSSVVSELGRHPYSTRRFFIKYQDRIVFGSDGGYKLDPVANWTPERMYRSYIEFLETDNEYIEYPLQSITKQGSWHVYGIYLPPEVLQKIYVTNAQKLLPSEADVKARLAALENAGPRP